MLPRPLQETAMASIRKREPPVDQARRFLEPGPVLLLCTQWRANARS